MSNIVEFNAAVPAHFRKGAAAALVEDLVKGVAASYPVISIKGKTWAIVKNGERTVILDSEREPVRSIKIVLVKANPQVSKVYYAEGYSEGSDEKPTCYSNDGEVPAADAAEKQSKKCATCPHNAWGSATSRETGMASKGKACSDSRRIAIITGDTKSEPMLLRVPPASLKNIADYGRALAAKDVPYFGVVTKLSFDPDAASPKIVPKFEKFLSEAEFHRVMEIQESDVVESICAKGPVPQGDGGTAADTERFDEHDRQAVATKPEPEPEPEPAPAPAPRPRARKPAAAPAPAPVQEPEDPPFDTAGGFGGDDEPAPAQAEARKAATQPASAAPVNDLEDDLTKAFAGFDD